MDITITISGPDVPENADELYAAEAYKAIDNFYTGKTLETIKQNTTLKGNTISVNGYLATKLFVGQEPYSLKKALTTSQRTTTSPITGEKQLKVPIKGKVVTMTEKSQGWQHPGFPSDYFSSYVEFIKSAEMESLMIDLFME